MSHSDIIIIVVTLTISSTLGVYAAIRVLNQYTRPPVNRLERTGDIELTNYIEPIRAQGNYPDLLASPEPTYQRIINSGYYESVPSYRSESLPSYHLYPSTDRWYINSCLENAINLDYLIILVSLVFLILFWKKYKNMLLRLLFDRTLNNNHLLQSH